MERPPIPRTDAVRDEPFERGGTERAPSAVTQLGSSRCVHLTRQHLHEAQRVRDGHEVPGHFLEDGAPGPDERAGSRSARRRHADHYPPAKSKYCDTSAVRLLRIVLFLFHSYTINDLRRQPL